MDLCLEAERCLGFWVDKRWWEQGKLELEGMRISYQEAEREEGGEETNGASS